MENKTNRQASIPGYLSPLDGVRAIATILIFVHHLWQQSWIGYSIKLTESSYLFNFWKLQQYGYIAIDILFVLSGFCLFYPVARAMFGETKETSIKTFYLKRARRIWPAYTVLLIIMLIFPIFAYAVPGKGQIGLTLKHYLSHMFFIHNFFPETIGSTISTAWTMPIEVQFYILFPFICMFFKKKPVLSFAAILIITQCIRMYYCANFDADPFNQGITFLYIDIFAWGMLSAYFVVYARNKWKNIDKLAWLMTAICIACLYAIWQYILWMDAAQVNGLYFRMMTRAILCGVVAVFLFASCYSIKLLQKKILGNKFFVFISTISYSFYLCHQNINIFLKRVNVPYTTVSPVMHDRHAMAGYSFLAIILSLIVAVILTYFVELPIAKYGYKGYFKRIPQNFKDFIQKLKNQVV